MKRGIYPVFVVVFFVFLSGCLNENETDISQTGPRRVISLDGIWEIAEGSMDSIPKTFEHRVPVPGLVDMAEPAFDEVGKKSDKREAFWYRRSFTVKGTISEVALLKIHKAKYGTRVFLNGKLIGDHLPCFTPALLDVRDNLKGSGATNEIIVRVGAFRDSVPESIPSGWDFEKYRYIPGIYDSVELVLMGSPRIINIQVVPDTLAENVKVVAEIESISANQTRVMCKVSEADSGEIISAIISPVVQLWKHKPRTVEVIVPMTNCRLWSPEDPFLYELEVSTSAKTLTKPTGETRITRFADTVTTRFGMRSFRFDKETGRAILNGKPYFMRGTNVCVYRFFEDALRGDRPWRKEWVRRLHRKFKSMQWNSIRYCIGFPPEIWYEIADEEGFLIQDEFPIWFLGREKWPKNLKSDAIAAEYTEWMRERWNHPCVVIWDAQNESVTDQTGKAVQAVRHLDLSNRPWENGWSDPQSPHDFVESHPYLFIKGWTGKESFRLREMANVSPVPHLRAEQKKLDVPIVINEYAWLWLNRDGTTTCLTDNVYKSLLGPDSTVAQRRSLYARYLAALTEFWRCHRKCAGVLHFCGLGYSRAGDKPRPEGGATSDHFLNIETLEFEPDFEKYVKDAFSPVGLCINKWDEQFSPGEEVQVPVIVINDLYKDWKGNVVLRILRGDETISEQKKNCAVSSLGQETLSFNVTVPNEQGRYQIVAELIIEGTPVRSLRDFNVSSSK
ncbi:MAG: glycoside hydrolase family 2 TIM barrel-domain containing protein [Planctomycetota bacterium]